MGSVFHSLHATSQALQPMQTEVSVKKPTRFGCSSTYPACSDTSGTGPYSRFPGSRPVKAALAELIVVMPASSLRSSSKGRALPCVGGDRVAAVHAHPAGIHSGPAAVALDEFEQVGPAWAPPGHDVAGADLGLLDVGVRIHDDAQQVVGRVAGGDARVGPVV